MTGVREKLVGLLDYIEQVVRLDERVAFQLSDYRLPDGSAFALHPADTQNLPGVRHDIRDEGEAVWLEVERLTRTEPPVPPQEIADWLVLSADPTLAPQPREERLVTVSAAEKDLAIAKGEAIPGDVLETPRKHNESANSPKKFDLRLRLSDRPETAAAIDKWVDEVWQAWVAIELPRRKTIAIYQKLYKIFQLLETGAGESPIEVAWGIGMSHWKKDGRLIERPLLERRVEIELNDARGGLIRVRPTTGSASFDLKPYEEIGCEGIPGISDLIQREIRRADEDDGVSPFIGESYELILSSAANRLDQQGSYAASVTDDQIEEAAKAERLLVTGGWVLFARPRSQHVVLQDIDRLRRAATDPEREISGLATRLVSEPSRGVEGGRWAPLERKIGGIVASEPTPKADDNGDDIFFPKAFNSDQIEIVKRLEKADGLVVQGPPGTGKTHTIANLICHAMATGQRVLVVSRGESALSVLRDQLPLEVQPLAIAVMTSEREGLRQIESAIRQVQAIVDGSRPESRRSAIARLETEIAGLQKKIAQIDEELDEIASAHLTKMGPKKETPAELAKRVVAQREAFNWFVDRPASFSSELRLSDRQWSDLDEARHRVGDLIDHASVVLPSSADLPSGEQVAAWHADLVRALVLQDEVSAGPATTIRVTAQNATAAIVVAQCLNKFAAAHELCALYPWQKQLFSSATANDGDAWCALLRERVAEWDSIDGERADLIRRSVELPLGLLENEAACDAVKRAADGERLWPLVTFGKGNSKALTSAIKIDGATLREDDSPGWQHVFATMKNLRRRKEATARWNAFVSELGGTIQENSKAQVDSARSLLKIADEFQSCASSILAFFPGDLGRNRITDDPALCTRLATQLKNAAAAVRLASARASVDRIRKLFEGKTDRTSVLVHQMFEGVVGVRTTPSEKVEPLWNGLLQRLEMLKALRPAFETIVATSDAIRLAGAPIWAQRLRSEATKNNDPALSTVWRDAWDHGASEAVLDRVDARQRLTLLSEERLAADNQCRKLFGELVRERTFYALDRRLSPSVKGALVEFVRALARIGKGTGKGAGKHRSSARDAMSRCYDAVPCWIMPTWRVAEQLPAEIGAIDLVIIDEASQSDVTELPALLRGRKLLVVGDDRQVSPTAPFVTQSKIDQLRHHYLGSLPFKSLLEPGESIYDLMRAVFPENRLMLKEHFRCVEPIIQFSMQFYPETILPLRIPAADERLDPPLVDIYVPHGAREFKRKINRAEAEVVIDEIKKLTSSDGKPRTIGVISLIGAEQAEFIRGRLSESIGEELMQRHAILCGDSATFQGTERDIVFLSMVADPAHKTALTMLRYEQRFNVAVSRARDRAVLVRSVRREELKPNDLKARLIAHFDDPMPMAAQLQGNELDRCDSDFERDVLRILLKKAYRARAQVGSLGYRIDIVVEGADGRRLAVECDGDRYHGPEQWRDDMRRQRVLERVGWRFWRCFASSFYRDRERVAGDLLATLERFGIEPLGRSEEQPVYRFTERRVIELPTSVPITALADAPAGQLDTDRRDETSGIAIGDRLNLIFADDKRRLSVRLTDGANDPDKGLLSAKSPLGQALVGAEEGDEVEFDSGAGERRMVLIESILRPEIAVHLTPSSEIQVAAK